MKNDFKIPKGATVEDRIPVTLIQLTWGGGMGGSSYKEYATDINEVGDFYKITTWQGKRMNINKRWIVFTEPEAQILKVQENKNKGPVYVVMREDYEYKGNTSTSDFYPYTVLYALK